MSTTSSLPKGARPSARRQETRSRLVDAAVQVIAERGVMGASVEQICEEAGFTRGAFYSNFETKDELWAAVLRDFLGAHLAAARQMTDEVTFGTTGTDALGDFVDMAIERFVEIQPDDQMWPIVNAELRLHALRNPEFRPVYLEIFAEIEQQLIDLLTPAFDALGLKLQMPMPQALALITAVHNSAQLEAGLRKTPGPATTAEDLKALLRTMLQT